MEAVAHSQSAASPLADVVSALAADHVALVAERDGALKLNARYVAFPALRNQ